MQVSEAKSRFGNLNKQTDVELTVDLLEKQLRKIPVNRQAQMGYRDILVEEFQISNEANERVPS